MILGQRRSDPQLFNVGDPEDVKTLILNNFISVRVNRHTTDTDEDMMFPS